MRERAALCICLRRIAGTAAIGSAAIVICDSGSAALCLHCDFIYCLICHRKVIDLLEIILERVAVGATLFVRTRVSSSKDNSCGLFDTFFEIREGRRIEFFPVTAASILGVTGLVSPPDVKC